MTTKCLLRSLIWFGQLLALANLAASSMELRFNDIERSADGLVRLQVSAPVGAVYGIDVSTNLIEWTRLVTVKSSGLDHHTDSAAPYHASRFYRTVSREGSDPLTGDHVATANGDATIHPVDHASFVMSWNGLVIYNDPSGSSSSYVGLPVADLILVSHTHGDHYNAGILESLRDANTRIIAPQAVYNLMTAQLKGVTTVLGNGASTTLMGVAVEAVPAYNSRHSQGAGNGYVINLGGKRIYMAGDTGDVAEMRALQNIDVAFLPMNLPYTMSVTQAASAIRDFQPRVIYPYHFRNQDGSFADLNLLRQLVGLDQGVEVRIRDWY